MSDTSSWSPCSPPCVPPPSRPGFASWRWPARGAFCVSEFTEILGQSPAAPVPPSEAAMRGRAAGAGAGRGECVVRRADRARPGSLTRELLARVAEDDPVLAADRAAGARVLAERARIASESFQRKGADWDEMRALDLPAAGGGGVAADAGAGGQRRAAAGYRHRNRARAGAAGAARRRRAGHRCQPGDAGAGARRGWRGPGWRIARCGWPTCTGCRCADACVRYRGAADGAASRRTSPRACWPRPRACCARADG